MKISKRQLWAGRILAGVAVAFLFMDSAMKLMRAPVVLEGTAQLGYPTGVIFGLGVLLLACTLLYAVPRTSVLGAVLLTGYLGGAIATHVRVGNPLFSHVLFPVYLGVMLWGALYLRNQRLRALLLSSNS
jgi:hypothetical protein